MTTNCSECCFRTNKNKFEKVVWEITFSCPLNCPYCFQERTAHRNILKKSELESIRNKVHELLADIKPSHVLLSGGEPLTLGEDLYKSIEFIKSIGSTFSLSTTGFPQKHFLKVLEYGPTGINISIDPIGFKGDQYEYRKTKFDTLKSTLAEISNRGIPIKGTSLITKDNLRNVPEYIDMLMKLKTEIPTLSAIFITNPYHIGYVRPDLSVAPDQVNNFIKSVESLDDLSIEVKFINFSSISMPLQECPAAKTLFCIVPNGDIVGCPFLYQRTNSFAVGNVTENDPNGIRMALNRFSEIIGKNNEQLLKLTPECKDCEVKENCYGGCFAETFAMKETSIPSLLCKRTVERAKNRDNMLISLPLKIRNKLKTGNPKIKFPNNSISEELETKISNHVKKYMQKTFSDLAHKFDHIEYVVRLAKKIAKEESANLRIVIPAAYFHDFSPRQHEAFHFHTDESADAAATFLMDNGFNEDEIAAIVHCIVASEFSSSLLGKWGQVYYTIKWGQVYY